LSLSSSFPLSPSLSLSSSSSLSSCPSYSHSSSSNSLSEIGLHCGPNQESQPEAYL
jgi:hypothetical protein